MSKTEMNGNGNQDPPQAEYEVPECGTPSTPPCPIQRVYADRRRLIEQLAGRGASRRRIEEVALQVDRYLITALEGVSVLVRNTQEHERLPQEHGSELPAPHSSAPK